MTRRLSKRRSRCRTTPTKVVTVPMPTARCAYRLAPIAFEELIGQSARTITDRITMHDTTANAPKPRFRAGWRIVLTAIGMLGYTFAAMAIFAVVPLSGLAQWLQQLTTALVMAGMAVAVAYCLRRFVDRKAWRGIGVSWNKAVPLHVLAGVGAATGVVVLVKLIAVAIGLDEFNHDYGSVSTGMLVSQLALGLLTILLNQAFPEELLWRGYLYDSLSPQWSSRATIIATAVGFGSLHVISNPGVTAAIGYRLLYALMAIGFGFALVSCRRLTGSIWLGVGFHAGSNLMHGVLGSNGYDLSLLVSFTVLVVFGLVMLRIASRRFGRRPATEVHSTVDSS